MRDKATDMIRYIVSDIIEVYKAEHESETLKKGDRYTLCVATSFLSLVCVVMSIMNNRVHHEIMEATTIYLAVVFLITGIVSIAIGKRLLISIVINTAVMSTFTYYILIGGNDGFAATWILIAPALATLTMGLRAGTIMSVYFSIVVVFFFLTPGSQLLIYKYTDNYMLRFPMVYFCSTVTTLIFGYRLEKNKLRESKYEAQLEKSVLDERKRVMNISLGVIDSINKAVEVKNPYTQEHASRVADYSVKIAKKLGFSKAHIDQIKQMAILHDVGKIGIPDYILNKPYVLTDEERELVNKHTLIGYEILSPLEELSIISVGSLYHHEWYDGEGYPYGVSGEEIPIEGRILAIADTIDAINSDRIYSRGKTTGEVIMELRKGSGKQFDPELITVAIGLIQDRIINCDTPVKADPNQFFYEVPQEHMHNGEIFDESVEVRN